MKNMIRDAQQTENMNHQSIYADKDNQILRLQSSDIAAIAGFHPYKDKLELLEKYLYQDLQSLYHLDAKNIGVELIDKEQQIASIISGLAPLDIIKLDSLRKTAKLRLVFSNLLHVDEKLSINPILYFNILKTSSVHKPSPYYAIPVLEAMRYLLFRNRDSSWIT